MPDNHSLFAVADIAFIYQSCFSIFAMTHYKLIFTLIPPDLALWHCPTFCCLEYVQYCSIGIKQFWSIAIPLQCFTYNLIYHLKTLVSGRSLIDPNLEQRPCLYLFLFSVWREPSLMSPGGSASPGPSSTPTPPGDTVVKVNSNLIPSRGHSCQGKFQPYPLQRTQLSR
jgi:hypothetical protein